MKQTQIGKKTAYRFRRFARKSYAAFNSMHKIVSIGVVSASMLAFAHVTETSAQSQPTTLRDSIPDQDLDEVLVSSSAADMMLNRLAQSITLISAQEIERQPARSIQDLLKSVAGLDIRQRGSNGVLAGISIRGGTFEQTAILLNGANLSNPQTAHYSLDLPINLSDIERIEIIQGPSSLLFGASAFSGGVNIITKDDNKNNAYLSLYIGMHQSVGGEARGSFRQGKASHSLSIGYDRSDGYIDNSDYRLFNSLWQTTWKSDGAKLLFNLGLNDKEYGANTFYSAAYPNQFDDTRSYFASLRGETQGVLKFTPQLYWNRHEDDYYLDRNKTPNVHTTDVYGFNLNGQYTYRQGMLNFGGEVRNEGIESTVLGKDNRTNISYFLSNTFLLDKLNLAVGVLANYNTALTSGFSLYPNVSASYQFPSRIKLFASWNTATRMPTFTDLYYTSPTHTGNSDLKPEKSSSFELGAKYESPGISFQLSGFYFEGKNMIDWVKERPEDLWQSANLTNVDKFGFEANLTSRYKAIVFSLGFLFMDQAKESSGWISNYVLDYLRYKLTASFSCPIYKNISADWQFRWQKREGSFTQYESLKPAYEKQYPAFALLDMKINWRLDKADIFLTANNLFDTSYYDLGNVPQPGLWITGGVSYRLE